MPKFFEATEKVGGTWTKKEYFDNREEAQKHLDKIEPPYRGVYTRHEPLRAFRGGWRVDSLTFAKWLAWDEGAMLIAAGHRDLVSRTERRSLLAQRRDVARMRSWISDRPVWTPAQSAEYDYTHEERLDPDALIEQDFSDRALRRIANDIGA